MSTIEHIKWGQYRVNNCTIEFQRNGRYDTFDGKYHPCWIVTMPDKTIKEGINKKCAIDIALNYKPKGNQNG